MKMSERRIGLVREWLVLWGGSQLNDLQGKRKRALFGMGLGCFTFAILNCLN